jgi:hypothetical protein
VAGRNVKVLALGVSADDRAGIVEQGRYYDAQAFAGAGGSKHLDDAVTGKTDEAAEWAAAEDRAGASEYSPA